MSAALGEYDLMRDSAVPWLGAIPEHWRLTRAKWLFEKLDRPVTDADDVVTCFRDGIVTLRKNRRLTGFTEALQEHGYQGVREGDLVIHAMDAFAGAVGVSDSNGKCTPVYAVCRPTSNADPWYYAYLVREMARSQWIFALSKGVRERSTDFRFDAFAQQVVPVPPPDEQTAIVRFIRNVDRDVGRFVEAKRRLIRLLEEQQQAMIQGAVTRGLDRGATLRPSHVEWLGDIPSHWELRRMRFVAKLNTGGRDTVDRVDDGNYPFYVRSQTVEKINSYSFDEEAVLTAGDGAGVGKVFHYHTGKGDYHQRVYKFSAFEGVRGKFFFYYLKANLALEVMKLSAKSTVDSLRFPMLKNFPITIPPLTEQDTIVDAIELANATGDQAILRAQREIRLLREYRTRLISDVVTGRVDVRAAAVELPNLPLGGHSGDEAKTGWTEGDGTLAPTEALT